MIRPVLRQRFTMLELLIVFAVVAIILAFAIPQFLKGKQRARTDKAVAKYTTLVERHKALAYFPCSSLDTVSIGSVNSTILPNKALGSDPTSPNEVPERMDFVMDGGAITTGPLPGTRAIRLLESQQDWGVIEDTRLMQGSDQITVCIWLKPESTDNQQNLLRKGYRDYSNALKSWILDRDAGRFRFWVRTPTNEYEARASSFTMQQNTWYFLVGVYNGTDPNRRIEIWINGEKLDDDTSVTGDINQCSSPIILGRRYSDAAGSPFADMPTGVVSNIAFFSTALSANQIKELYDTGKP